MAGTHPKMLAEHSVRAYLSFGTSVVAYDRVLGRGAAAMVTAAQQHVRLTRCDAWLLMLLVQIKTVAHPQDASSRYQCAQWVYVLDWLQARNATVANISSPASQPFGWAALH